MDIDLTGDEKADEAAAMAWLNRREGCSRSGCAEAVFAHNPFPMRLCKGHYLVEEHGLPKNVRRIVRTLVATRMGLALPADMAVDMAPQDAVEKWLTSAKLLEFAKQMDGCDGSLLIRDYVTKRCPLYTASKDGWSRPCKGTPVTHSRSLYLCLCKPHLHQLAGLCPPNVRRALLMLT